MVRRLNCFGGRVLFVLCSFALMPLVVGQDNDIEPASPFDLGIYVEDLDRTQAFYEAVFGLRVRKRWDHLINFNEDGTETRIDLSAIYMGGDNGLSFEFIERANVTGRQVVQQPINHFALKVDDAEAALERALNAGAKLSFPDQRLFVTLAADMKIIHTQIIGLDSERIQILQLIE